jgi:Fe-S-cluster containining protein
MSNIGRNAPCLCGSGKKYKNCCLNQAHVPPNNDLGQDYFKLNKVLAYKGVIGRNRSEFCASYISQKKAKLQLVEQEQGKNGSEANKSITCHKGCSYCCSSSVQASLQECEAIVYFLYKNDDVFNAFLKRYPKWREALRRNGDIFKSCLPLWQSEITPDNEQAVKQLCDQEIRRYYKQDIPCPFLQDNLCSIYSVRPYACAALIAFSQPDLCRSASQTLSDNLLVYPSDVEYENSFYYGKLGDRILSFMPLTVYEILKNGTYYLSQVVPGLENLYNEFRTDPEVASLLLDSRSLSKVG